LGGGKADESGLETCWRYGPCVSCGGVRVLDQAHNSSASSVRVAPRNPKLRGATTGQERDSPCGHSDFCAHRFSTWRSIEAGSGPDSRAIIPAVKPLACGAGQRIASLAEPSQARCETPEQPSSGLGRESIINVVLGRHEGRPRRKTRCANHQDLRCLKDRAIRC
jgi:hypothetical protein